MQNTTTLAAEFETTPRTLRKFLRSAGLGVGKGSRYSLPTSKREVNAMKKQFDSWSQERAAEAETAEPEVEAEV